MAPACWDHTSGSCDSDVALCLTGALEQERRERARDARGFHEELEGLLDRV
jgi:hypothetical protein